MNNWIINFLIESGISLIVLYLFYWIVLRKLTFFSLNRLILLGTLVFSFLLPLINISLKGTNNTETTLLDIASRIGSNINLPAATIKANENQSFFQAFDWKEMLFLGYLLGVIILAINLLIGILKVYLMSRTRNIKLYPKYSLVFTNKAFAPFSFLNKIFINKSLIQENQLDEIIAHELAHIEQRHTIDVLVIEFFLTIQWFNPVMWLYRRSLKETHEYLADHSVINKGYNQTSYQTLLLKYIKGLKAIELTNNFNRSLIKKRIAMMTKKQSTKLTFLRIFILLPIILSLILVLACSKSENPQDEINLTIKEEVIAVEPTTFEVDNTSEDVPEGEEIFFIVEDMPSFQGKGPEGFREWVAKNLRYPENAAENGISGRVFVQFIVRKDGSISNVNVVKGAHPDLDAEAIRVIKASSSEWTPGVQKGHKVNVAYTFPIVFVLE